MIAALLEILAGLFGVGVGLTLDEFALWLHLEDVYWSAEGRSSVDAVIVATILGGMLVAGAAPLGTDEGGSVVAIAAVVLANLLLVIVAIGKGKLLSAVLGAFVPLVALVSAARLAKPDSRWAKRRYRADSGKIERATRRNARNEALQDRLFNLIGGVPSNDGADDGRDP